MIQSGLQSIDTVSSWPAGCKHVYNCLMASTWISVWLTQGTRAYFRLMTSSASPRERSEIGYWRNWILLTADPSDPTDHGTKTPLPVQQDWSAVDATFCAMNDDPCTTSVVRTGSTDHWARASGNQGAVYWCVIELDRRPVKKTRQAAILPVGFSCQWIHGFKPTARDRLS
jgi:hypothetical protein